MNTDRLKTARPLASLREGRNDWYRIRNQGAGVAEVYIYDEIGWFGVTAADFVRDLQGIDAEAIDLHMNTPGGDVFDGLAILEALRSHKAHVTVYVDSLAASIGSVIAMAGDRIVMARNATLMIHDGHGLAIGNAADMREMADLLDRCSDNIASVYAGRAGGTVEDWRAAMRATTWYTADEAVAAGLADEVKAPNSSRSAPAATWDLSIFGQVPDRVHVADLEDPAGGVRGDGHPAPENTAERHLQAHPAAAGDGADNRADPPEFRFNADLFRTAVKEAATQ